MWRSQPVALQPSNTSGGEGQHALPPAAGRRRYISPFALISEQDLSSQPSVIVASLAPNTPPNSHLGKQLSQSALGEFCAPRSPPIVAGGSYLFADASAPEISPNLAPEHEAASPYAASDSGPILFPGGRRKWSACVPEAPLSREQQAEASNAQSWPDQWLNVLIDDLMEEMGQQHTAAFPSKSPARRGGSAAADSFLRASPRLPRQIRTVTEGGAEAGESRGQPGAKGAWAEGEGGAAPAGMQQAVAQEALTQRFRDADLEQRFRLYQARMLRPVDILAALIGLMGVVAIGFSPGRLATSAPLLWLLGMAPHVLVSVLASRAPLDWYCQHRETVIVIAAVWVMFAGLGVYIPNWLPLMDAARLRVPLNVFRFSGSECTFFMLVMLRIRLRGSMALSLLLAGMCITLLLPQAAATFEALGVASAARVMCWGSLWHLTAGILLPALVASHMESCERRHFLEELAPAARAARKAKAL